MKQNTETLISIGVVAAAILISIARPDASTVQSTQVAEVMAASTQTLTFEEKQQRCMEDKDQAFQTIRESLALIETLSQNSADNADAIAKHFQDVNSAKASIETCQALIADYESKITTLENEIIALQSEE